MAERRMFAKTIIDSDSFLEMPQSTQLLYFHLSMRADDDGFINKPKSVMRMVYCKDDDLRILITKKFIIPFESGVVVIKHWRIHNYIRNDRYNETKYIDEKSQLEFDDNNAYRLTGLTDGIPLVTQMDTQVRLGKDSIVKAINKGTQFVPPSLEDVREYCQKRNNKVNPEGFINFYESKGWMIGKNKMRSWMAAVRTWEIKDKTGAQTKNQFNRFEQRQYSDSEYTDMEQKLLGKR